MLQLMSDFTKKFMDIPGDNLSKDTTDIKDYLDSSPREIRNYLLNLVSVLNSISSGSSGAENIGSAPITGLTGNTVYDQIANLLIIAQQAQAGTIAPGTVTDTMLSNAAGMIKDMLSKLDTPYPTTNVLNAYSVTGPTITSYTDGFPVLVKWNADSTGAITLNINGKGAINVIDSLKNPVANVKANTISDLRYEANTNSFILLGKGGGGTAQPSDIVNGKTATVDSGFITGTATIESLGGKKWASGTVTSSSATSTVTRVDNATATYSMATVTGLTFKPSIIILKYKNSATLESMTTYIDNTATNLANNYSPAVYLSRFYTNTSDATQAIIKGDVSPCSVTSTGFTLPVLNASSACSWIAYE